MSDTELIRAKDAAYWERNQLVAALSKVFPAHLAKHPDDDKDWDDDWRTIIVIQLPLNHCSKSLHKGYECVHTQAMGKTMLSPSQLQEAKILPAEEGDPYYQLSWHIHDNEIPMFDHLKYEEFIWDGHTNEDKYRRLRHLKP